MDLSRTTRILRPGRPSALLALASLLALGCGGKGGGVGAETASVSATPATIPYGADARVAWSAASSASFDSSNFGPDASNFHGGSIVDTPGTTTVYELKVRSATGNTVPARAKVTVAPKTVSVLVVGDPSKPGPAQTGAFLRTLVSGNVAVASALEAPSDRYGVLVVSPTFAPQAGSAATAKAWLDAGKGVVLCGVSPRLLATGNPDDTDVSAIGSWFLGASTLERDDAIGNSRVRSGTGTVRLSAAIRGGREGDSDMNTYVNGLGPQVDVLGYGYGVLNLGERDVMCAYPVPTGGRLVWSASPVGYGIVPKGTFQQAFESAVNWASG